jgi:sugar phosphate isomerase/epimerase
MIWEKQISPYDFAEYAHNLGFNGLEYVNQLYPDVMLAEDKTAAIEAFVAKNNELAKKYQLQNVLIMIDGEGSLSVAEEAERKKAVENHKLWIDAASAMNCAAVRVNLHGSNDPVVWNETSVQSLTELAQYGSDKNITVLVENHGRLSSNGKALMAVINTVNLPNCGTLPDFGNFCIADDGYGSITDKNCSEIYDIYQGVEEMMPKAMALSAKSFDFDAEGNETSIDYSRMLSIANKFNYQGFIGIEFEGNGLSEIEGIVATRNLVLRNLSSNESN